MRNATSRRGFGNVHLYVERINSTQMFARQTEQSVLKLDKKENRQDGILDPTVPEMINARIAEKKKTLQNENLIFQLRETWIGGRYETESVVAFLNSVIGEFDEPEVSVKKWLEYSLQYHKRVCHAKLKDPDFLDMIDIAEEDFLHAANGISKTLSTMPEILSFTELLGLILSLSLWQGTYYSELQFPHTKKQDTLMWLHQKLDKISCERISFYTEESVDKLHHPWFKLILAKAWLQVFSSTHNHFADFMMFKVAFEGKNSRTFFRKLDPECLVDLASVMRRRPKLPEGFHTYYAVYKFHEFSDYLSIPELALICRAFKKHKVSVDTKHPIYLSLMSKVWGKLIDHMCHVETEDFCHIDNYFSFVPLHHIQNGHELASNAMKNGNLDVGSLIRVLGRVGEPAHDKLSSIIQQEILQGDINISLREVVILLRFIANEATFDEEIVPHLLNRTVAYVKSLDLQSERVVEVINTLLWFVYNGVFDKELFEKVQLDSRIFRQQSSGSEVDVAKKMLYSTSPDNMMICRMLCIIHGLGKLHSMKTFLFSSKSQLILAKREDFYPPPTTSLKFTERPDNPYETFEIVGSHTLEIFGEKSGITPNQNVEEFIWSTSVLPFFPFLHDYIFCRNKLGDIVRIPKEFRSMHLPHDIKRIPQELKSDYTWHTLTLVHPISSKALLKIALNDPKMSYFRCAKDLGYSINVFDFRAYARDDPSILQHYKDFIKNI